MYSVNPSNAEASFFLSTRMHIFWKKSYKTCNVGIHWIALTEYSQMSTHLPGFQSYFRFHDFVLAKLATSNIMVNHKAELGNLLHK